MRKTLAIVAVAGLALPSTAFAAAGAPDTASASAQVKVVRPITVACDEMNFGTLAAQNVQATVTLPPQGFPFSDNPDVIVPGDRTEGDATGCTVVGERHLAFTITLPPGPVSLTKAGGGSMALGSFVLSSPSTSFVRTLTTDASGLAGAGAGSAVFSVGATLTVGANQPAGVYNGTYPVTVQYN